MNLDDRQELEQISREHRELREHLAAPERRIEELNRRIARESVTPASAAHAAPPPAPTPAPAHVPPIPEKKAVPPPLPRMAAPTPEPIPPEPVRAAPPPRPKTESKSFEMQVGTYWMVRVGVVMLLTALVFFGNYAYQHYIANFGPAGKLTLLYLLSGVLLGTGFWLARTRESMRNFGNVLMAGGMAAVYYSSYAAYFNPGLKVIDNAILAGSLLMAWSALMVWIADRRKSQTMALFSILLAYYTSIINPIGQFTLFSNLVLTAVGVFFLIRNRWAGMTYASLFATYLSYGYWRFHQESGWIFDLKMTTGDFWEGNLFLLGYWTLFTAAVIWSKHDNFTGANRATFLSINNAAFFAHVLVTLQLVYPGSFWKFALGFGAVLILLAWVCRLRHPDDTAAEGSYLVQGLSLATAGIIAYYSGHTLALILALESVILLVCGHLQNNRILKAGAYLVAPLAVMWTLDSLGRFDREAMILACGAGAAMIFNGWWVRRSLNETELVVHGRSAYFALLGLALWMAATFQNTVPQDRAVVLAIEALLLTFSIYLLRMPEVTVIGQAFLVLAQILAITQMGGKQVPWWNPAIVIAATLAAGHWWQHQKILASSKGTHPVFQFIYAAAVVGVLYAWLENRFDAQQWLVVTSCLSIGMLFYGIVTRAWFLALLGQFFLVISGIQFLIQLGRGDPLWYVSLVPVVTVFGTGLIVRALVRDPSRTPGTWDDPLIIVTRIYRAMATIMFVFWVFEYVPEREQFWSFSLAGFFLYLWGAWKQNGMRLVLSGAITLMGLMVFFFVTRGQSAVYWPNWIACVLILASQQIGKRLLADGHPGRAGFNWMIGAGILALWVLVSRWMKVDFGGFSLTAAWGIYALVVFGTGFALRERAYRLLGLTILSVSIVKVMFDVWHLGALSRIISFTVLGIVLLLLGFVYTRYQEKIKNWL